MCVCGGGGGGGGGREEEREGGSGGGRKKRKLSSIHVWAVIRERESPGGICPLICVCVIQL